MPTIPISPSAFQAQIAADRVRSRALQTRLDELQDALDEARWAAVPFNSAAWFDPTRWTSCDAYPDDVSDDELSANWPGGQS